MVGEVLAAGPLLREPEDEGVGHVLVHLVHQHARLCVIYVHCKK